MISGSTVNSVFVFLDVRLLWLLVHFLFKECSICIFNVNGQKTVFWSMSKIATVITLPIYIFLKSKICLLAVTLFLVWIRYAWTKCPFILLSVHFTNKFHFFLNLNIILVNLPLHLCMLWEIHIFSLLIRFCYLPNDSSAL